MRSFSRTVVALSFVLTLLSLTAVQSSRATQILYQTPRQLGTNAELVVHGRVVDVESHWNDKRTKIFTTTRIAVEGTYKGDSGSVVEVVQLGGTVDNIRVHVSGALQWRQGEEVLLFLEPYENKHVVSGFSQGKFNVKRDEKTGEAYIERPELEGVEIMGAPSKDTTTRLTGVKNVPLEEFVNNSLGKGSKGGAR